MQQQHATQVSQSQSPAQTTEHRSQHQQLSIAAAQQGLQTTHSHHVHHNGNPSAHSSAQGISSQATGGSNQLHTSSLDPQQQSMLYWQMMQQGALANQHHSLLPPQPLHHPTHQTSAHGAAASKSEQADANHAPTSSAPQGGGAPPAPHIHAPDGSFTFNNPATLNNLLQAFAMVQNGIFNPAAAAAVAAGQLGPPLPQAIPPIPPIVTTARYTDHAAHHPPTLSHQITSSQQPDVPVTAKLRPLTSISPVSNSMHSAREKNRVAQQKFREKQKRQITELAGELMKLQQKYEESLREIVTLKEENAILKTKLDAMQRP